MMRRLECRNFERLLPGRAADSLFWTRPVLFRKQFLWFMGGCIGSPQTGGFFSEHLPGTSISLYFSVLFHLNWLNYTFYLFELVIFLSPRTSRLPVPVSLLSLPLLLLIPQLYLGKDSGKNFFLLLPTLWHTFCSLKRYPHRPETIPGFPPGTAPAASRQTDLCTP